MSVMGMLYQPFPVYCSRIMYQELRPIQMRVPVETSSSILSLKPEGQRRVTSDRSLDQRFVPTRHIRYSNTHQVMAATATIKAEISELSPNPSRNRLLQFFRVQRDAACQLV